MCKTTVPTMETTTPPDVQDDRNNTNTDNQDTLVATTMNQEPNRFDDNNNNNDDDDKDDIHLTLHSTKSNKSNRTNHSDKNIDTVTNYWPEDDDPSQVEQQQSRKFFFVLYRRLNRFARCWTYSYMRPILRKGSQQYKNGIRLNHHDLYPIPEYMQANHLSNGFRKFYQKLSIQNNTKHDSNGSDIINDKDSKKKEEGPRKTQNGTAATNQHNNENLEHTRQRRNQLMSTLWKIAAPTFIPAGFCQLITVSCQVAVPLLVREILIVVEDYPYQNIFTKAIQYAILLFITALLNAVGNHRQRHLSMKTGIILRSSLITILYEYVLQLSPKGKSSITSGEINNLIATDTQKLYEVTQDGHLIWSLPLSVILTTSCLLVVLGPTTLVGIGVLILFVPLVERVTMTMLKIRKKRIVETDKRIELINSMLQGIKITKLNSYEENYLVRANSIRGKELVFLRQELAVWALTLVVTVITPMIATAATFVVYVLMDESHVLTASQTFSVLLLFSALRFPINYAGRFLGKATQAYSSLQRIANFLDRDLRKESVNGVVSQSDVSKSDEQYEFPLKVENGVFYTGDLADEDVVGDDLMMNDSNKSTSFTVSKFNFSVKKGEVLAVCGPVGSGKSLLINGIIDEIPSAPGTIVTTRGKVSYISQNAFILNTSFRDNILFGRPFERELYEKIIDACGLRTDIALMGPARDFTEIGERGVTLSGGQKQRVSLARGIYAQPDLILLDDPLSALDAGTSKKVFERLIKGPDALLSSSAVVLVTHAAHFLNRVDKILILVDGRNRFLGTWSELNTFVASDPKTQGAIDHITASVQEDATTKPGTTYKYNDGGDQTRTDEKEAHDHLMSVEEREYGLSSFSTWLLWFKRAGGVYFLFFQFFFLAIDRTAYVAVEWWLTRWTSGAYKSISVNDNIFAPQSDGRSAQYDYLTVYVIIILTSIVATIIRSEWAVTGGVRAAKNVHSTMLESILGAPMSYFETTPMGRILNRFTYDTEVIDVTLTLSMSVFLISLSWYTAGVFVMCSIIPWMIFAIVPITVVYWVLLLHYRKTGADLQRLDAISRSPIQAMVSEGLDGGPAIRLYGQQRTFLTKFQTAINVNSSAVLNFISAQRWLGLRVEILGSTIAFIAAILIISLNDVFRINPGLIGLLIIWSSHFTITLGFLVDAFSEAEASITSIERVDAMSKIPQEKNRKTDGKIALPPSWPEHGELQFNNVCMRYRDGLPLALNNLSFKIPAEKKCGVVGRTGSGKSSVCSVLFRLVEVESGTITLDGIDLGTIGLADVRGRPNGMAIIPQDPFLAGSSLRHCIDPFGQSNDTAILDCLISVRLVPSTSTIEILDSPVEEGGSNYSVGERQLLNLARALLSQPKLLVLDEATASIDGETDAFIQQMLRTKFRGTTQITVAHRLNTIMDFDYVLVLDKGRVTEMGSPLDLLNQNGIFAQLVDATGPESSKALRAMVLQDTTTL